MKLIKNANIKQSIKPIEDYDTLSDGVYEVKRTNCNMLQDKQNHY